MALLFNNKLNNGSQSLVKTGFILLGYLSLTASVQAQSTLGVFQGDTTGSTFYDGSVAVGVGIPTTSVISDFWNSEVAANVAQQATKIATEITNLSPNSVTQKTILAVLTNPTKESVNSLNQILVKSGVSAYLAQEMSDRLSNLFKPDPNRVRKWRPNSDLDLDPKQLAEAVKTYNQIIQSLDIVALTSPNELITLRDILAQLVASSTPNLTPLNRESSQP